MSAEKQHEDNVEVDAKPEIKEEVSKYFIQSKVNTPDLCAQKLEGMRSDTNPDHLEVQIDYNIHEQDPIKYVQNKGGQETEQEPDLKIEDEDSQRTQPYNLNKETSSQIQTVVYSEGDFETHDSELDTQQEAENSEMGQIVGTSKDPSESKEPWQKVDFKKKKTKARQATVNEFFAGASKETKNGWQNKNNKGKKITKFTLQKRMSDRDTEMYRSGYPGKKDDPTLTANKDFYMGKIKSVPSGDYIDKIHEDWFGDYQLLERHHGYIQWLFPIREDGMNSEAQALQLHEAQAIKADTVAKGRVLKSYKLMLDFYGMELLDENTGKLGRSRNYEDCFENLNWSSHNYLRITRILKCLGELGYEHLKKGFIEFILDEALVHRTLEKLLRSCRDYWIGTIKDDSARDELHQFIEENA